jgi:hypothetical protein
MLGRLLLIGMFATTLAFGQRGSGGGGADTGAMDNSIMRIQPQSKAEMFADRLKLNKEQREKTQVILNDALKEIAQLRAQIDRNRVQIAESIINDRSQDDLNKLMDTYTTAVAQVTGIEVKAFAKVSALLRPNQLSRAASAFDLLAAALDPPGGAGRGGSGGRRGRN